MKKLSAKTVKISTLDQKEIETMFSLFSKYYESTTYEVFLRDLQEKEIVFLLIDKKLKQIKGFSTIVEISLRSKGKTVRSFFSGDTIIDKEYWGQRTLGKAFLKFLFIQKLKQPLTPLYWFLISKGYKTYLLMANNFQVHYPRYEQKTPEEIKIIIDALSEKLFPDAYDKNLGVIKSDGKDKEFLREGISPITPDMKIKNKRINFFDSTNPHWSRGDELACLAEMKISMPLMYQIKSIKKLRKKHGK